jgi:hypothetical protein
VCRFWEHEVFTDLEGAVATVQQAVAGEGTPPLRWVVWKVEPISEDDNQERRHLVRLRDGNARRQIEQRRHTRKWKRPR